MARYGAVDIGSNSIRMEAAEVVAGQPPRSLARDREVTRLGETVYRHGEVGPEAMDQTTRVLRRIAETLRKENVLSFRAVATSAVRDCRNQEEFLRRVQQALGGVPAEIISGREEARLIHLGVLNRWPLEDGGRVVIDIGGGSAEIIESRGETMTSAWSRPLGAVRLTETFFPGDPPTPAEIRRFADYVREKTADIKVGNDAGRNQFVATAATAAATLRAIHRVPSSQKDAVDRRSATTAQVRSLFEELSRLTLRRRRFHPGIGTRRAEIIVAGSGVLAMILEALGAGEVSYSAAGVRDGIIADLAARGVARSHARLDADQRRTAREMACRYGVNREHAERVAELAGQLFDALEPLHRLEPAYGGLLEAAAYLHDTGHFVSGTRHHRHSSYLVLNSDLPGFTDRERLFVANLCRYHRKNMPRSGQEYYKALDAKEKKALLNLIPLLRLADSLDRGHEQRVRSVAARITREEVELLLEGAGSTELESWAALQNARLFEQTYDRSLRVATRT